MSRVERGVAVMAEMAFGVLLVPGVSVALAERSVSPKRISPNAQDEHSSRINTENLALAQREAAKAGCFLLTGIVGLVKLRVLTHCKKSNFIVS